MLRPPTGFSTLGTLAFLALFASAAYSQVYQTTPNFLNPSVRPSGTAAQNSYATALSGNVYAATNRPVETGSKRYQIASWAAGATFSSASPDFFLGDAINPPPLTDLNTAPAVLTTNGAFYVASTKQLIAAQGGPVMVAWPTTTGGTNTVTYNIGAVPIKIASRLFWTDNFTTNSPVNTNPNAPPDNTAYAVSLSGIYAKVHYNNVVPDFDSVNSQDTADGRSNRSTNAVMNLNLAATWIDGNNTLRCRNQSGYFVIEYFDTSSYTKSVAYEIVYAGAPVVHNFYVTLGSRLLPDEGESVADDPSISVSTAKAGSYALLWSTAGSDFFNWLFAVQVNSDTAHPLGDSSKTQALWQRKGNLGVLWPYEADWYGIAWPGDSAANLFVFDPSNVTNSPAASIPSNYTASIVWDDNAGQVVSVNSGSSQITPLGDGRALIQYQNSKDVWFIPVRAVARTNGAYVSNQQVFWPVGVPLQPVATPPQLQFNGVNNELSLETELDPGLTVEMWIKPASLSNLQNLVAWLDYPQQSVVQAALSLSNSTLTLSVLTNGTSNAAVLRSVDTLPANTWSHVAFTKSSSGTFKLFLNGVLESSLTVTNFNGQVPANLSYAQCIIGGGMGLSGAAQQPLAPFAGQLSVFRLWSAEVSATDLAANMSANLTGSEANLEHLIVSEGEQSYSTADDGGLVTFLAPDLVTGDLVQGYGTPNTTGNLPFALQNQLQFDGQTNWVGFPLALSNASSATIEFTFIPDATTASQSILGLNTATATNLAVGLKKGVLNLAWAGSVKVTGKTTLAPNINYRVSLTLTNSIATLYLGSSKECSYTITGGNASGSLASTVTLAAGTALANYAGFAGVLTDLRVYSAVRTTDQISQDSINAADLTDSTLVRLYAFDHISQGPAAQQPVLTLPDLARGFDAAYYGSPTLGAQIVLTPPPEVSGGLVRNGSAYHPGIYSSEHRIIPVNDTPTNSTIEVWWPSTFNAPSLQDPLQFPGQVNTYKLIDPLAPPVLVVAGQRSQGYQIPSSWLQPVVYYNNDPTQAGFNPNEEHALIIGSSVYALRWDLNSDATSHDYILLQYQDANRNSLTYLQPIAVLPTNAAYPTFNTTLFVGQLVQGPMPLPDLPASSLSGPPAGGDPNQRLYQDRKYSLWVQSAITSGTNYDSASVIWHYSLQPSFYWPSNIVAGSDVPFGNSSNGLAISYQCQYPPNVPVLALGQTLSDAVPSADGDGFLPAVTGQLSVETLYDDAHFKNPNKTTVILEDPTTPSSVALAQLQGIGATEVQFGKTYFTTLPPHLRERVYWDPQAMQLSLTGAIVRPITGFPYVLPAWLSPADYSALAALSTDRGWQTAVSSLRRTANVIPDAETPFTSLVLTPTSQSGGYITLGVNTRTNLNNTGEPVFLYPIFVDTNRLYTGVINVILSDNQFDQYVTMRHSGDFGGDPSQITFDWRYTFPVDGQVPTTTPSSDSSWIVYTNATAGLNNIVFGGPGLLTLQDLYFACRWRSTAAGSPNTNWSAWTSPVLVQSWLTRAMNGIGPYNQRVGSLSDNQPDLTSSILSQAGKRYVGNVPLNTANADSYGLIETYETLLEQARYLSIDSGYSDDNVNASLLESASKLNDLYDILGDEAYSDAKDPTVAWGTRDLNDVYFGSRASSLFAFEGMVPSLLEEELALLRGRDDTTSTPVTTYPVYNRLYWNFTGGINAGEPAYAMNYGISSVAGDPNGTISAADAAKLYPQGHGDAYGHYLTALMNYYQLLANTNFTWAPRTEVVPVGGVNVSFFYEDERKMASTAVQLSKVALDVIQHTFRRDFSFDPTKKTVLFQDSDTNRAWAASEWCDRGSQGAYYNWAVLNSLLPSAATNDTPQTISRASVPELSQLAGSIQAMQDASDAVDRGDSPMQLSANVVPFDLDPALLDAGISHFEQVYARAVSALSSAYNMLQRASASAANLRRQNVSLETFRDQVATRESEFNSQLVDLYGTPYSDDIGPTGAFVSGYTGPDLYHYNYIDRDLFSPADAGAVTNVDVSLQYAVTGPNQDTLSSVGANVSYSINNAGLPVIPDSWTGARSVYGKIQAAIGDYIHAWVSLRGAVANQQNHKQQLSAQLQRLQDHNAYSDYYGAIGDSLSNQQLSVQLLQEGLDGTLSFLDTLDAEVQAQYQASKDPIPQSFIAGLADGGDLSFPARIGLAITDLIGESSIGSAKDAASFASFAAGKLSDQLNNQIANNDANLAAAEYQSQTALQTTILLSQVNADRDSVYGAAVALKQAWQNYLSLISKGNQIQSDLTAFRAQNSSQIQEARYAESVFRTFRNQDLEQYNNSFNLAARYTFAAAKVYDYETGLLDPLVVSRQAGDFLGGTMLSEQVGDMIDGKPVLGGGGDNTLGNVLAQMEANWSALKGRFGINNPTLENHAISLRWELFRIGTSTNSAMQEEFDTTWQNKLYTYKVPDIRQVPEFKNFCQLYSPMQTNEPALVIRFSTEINAGKNLFGLPLAGGDTIYDPTHFTTKIRGCTLSLVSYNQNVGSSLTKTPRAYLFPVGIDRQRTPISGGTQVRDWQVADQVWPIPYPSAAGNVDLSLQDIGTDNVHMIRKFPAMLAYDDADLATMASTPYDARLVGRSVWNTGWCLIIPASSLSSSTATALDTFIQGVEDIKLLLETYSYSGN